MYEPVLFVGSIYDGAHLLYPIALLGICARLSNAEKTLCPCLIGVYSLENAVELVHIVHIFLSFRCAYCFPENCQLSGLSLLASLRCGKLMTILCFILQTLCKFFGVLLAKAVSHP